jgi:hypothetical protein
MNVTVVQGLEQQLKDAKELVERRDLVLELSNNRAFRKVIMDGFCRDDCARFTHESTDPNLTPLQRADALQSAQAAGALKRFLSQQFQLGQTASADVNEIEENLAEARAEEDAASTVVNQPAETHGDLA